MSGFTTVSNVLWDWQIDNKELSNSQRIFAMVVRYTVCFHREWHEMSLNFISERTGMLRNNVSRELKSMIKLGIIREQSEGNKRLLAIGCVIESDNASVINSDNGGVIKNDNRSVIKSDNQEIKQSKYNNLNNDHSDLFDQFWLMYPRKVSKPQAVKAFKAALQKTKVELIIEGLDGYINHLQNERTETKYIKHPATWLNAEGWNDYKLVKQESKLLQLLMNHSDKELENQNEIIRKRYRKSHFADDRECGGAAR